MSPLTMDLAQHNQPIWTMELPGGTGVAVAPIAGQEHDAHHILFLGYVTNRSCFLS